MNMNLTTQDDKAHLMGKLPLKKQVPCGDNSSIGYSAISDQTANCTGRVISVISGELERVYHGDIWTPEVTQRIVTLAVIMTLTLLGNVTIIIVLTCSKYRKLNSRVNIFIVNLAVGDLTVCCFTMTTEVLFVVFEGAWVMGPAGCKILLYIQIVTMASTTFILSAMSYDRYVAICKPFSLGTTSSHARRMIIISWLMAFAFAVPQLLIFKQVATGVYPDGEIKYKCQSKGYTHWWQRKLYFTFMAAYILVIPSIIISFCYINVVKVVWRQGKDLTDKTGAGMRRTIKDKAAIPRAKIKTIKMTLSIICSFIACWTPYFVVHLIHIWSEYHYKIPEPVYVFAETMALLNSALNPILYGCFNIKLKRGLVEVFCPHRVPTERTRRNRFSSRIATGFVCASTDYASVNTANRTTKTKRCMLESGLMNGGHVTRDTKDESQTNHRPRDNFITEENKNGFRLRVRFVPESSRSSSVENESCLSEKVNSDEVASMPTSTV